MRRVWIGFACAAASGAGRHHRPNARLRKLRGVERRLVDPQACRRYAAAARTQLARRVADERAKP